jgi:hypothetical protein
VNPALHQKLISPLCSTRFHEKATYPVAIGKSYEAARLLISIMVVGKSYPHDDSQVQA